MECVMVGRKLCVSLCLFCVLFLNVLSLVLM